MPLSPAAIGMSSSPPTLLLTAAGTGTAFAYALAFAQHVPQGRLITADTNPAALVSAACLAAAHVQLPPVAETGSYLDALDATIRDHGITHYLPIIDPEIAFAASMRDRIPAEVIAPPADFAELAIEKHRYPERLGPLGIPTPAIIPPALAAHALPCIAKLAGGFGGRACWRIERAEDLAALPAGHFLQELVDGPEFTVDCFPLAGSDVLCSVRKRLEIKAGVCTKAEIAPHPIAEDYARRLVQSHRLQSPFCFQMIGDDKPSVTDINPRLGAGTSMSAANGMDFFAAHVCQVFGIDWTPQLRRLRQTCFVTRQYVEFLGVA
jgi:hypothetical protein